MYVNKLFYHIFIYQYDPKTFLSHIKIWILILDPLLLKRLDFVSEYDVDCSLTSGDSLTISTLQSIADANFSQI